MRASEETQLQETVITLLRHTARQGVVFYHCPNGERRDPRTAARLKRMGVKPGVADICLTISGRSAFLELKSKAGRQSKEQKAFELECEASGASYAVAHSFDEAQTVLREWGALRLAGRS